MFRVKPTSIIASPKALVDFTFDRGPLNGCVIRIDPKTTYAIAVKSVSGKIISFAKEQLPYNDTDRRITPMPIEILFDQLRRELFMAEVCEEEYAAQLLRILAATIFEPARNEVLREVLIKLVSEDGARIPIFPLMMIGRKWDSGTTIGGKQHILSVAISDISPREARDNGYIRVAHELLMSLAELSDDYASTLLSIDFGSKDNQKSLKSFPLGTLTAYRNLFELRKIVRDDVVGIPGGQPTYNQIISLNLCLDSLDLTSRVVTDIAINPHISLVDIPRKAVDTHLSPK